MLRLTSPAFLPHMSSQRSKSTLEGNHIPIFSLGACSRARAVTETDLIQWGAKFGSPAIFVSLVEWADRIITEIMRQRCTWYLALIALPPAKQAVEWVSAAGV